MKKFNATIIFKSVGTVTVEVPDNFNKEQAIEWVKQNMKEVRLPYNAEFIEDSEEVDEENCDFNE